MPELSESGLARGRDALHQFLSGRSDLTGMLETIAGVATEAVRDCDVVSITMLRGGHPTTVVSTGRSATAIDLAQYDLGDGPCLSALRHRGTEHFNVATDGRWPSLAREASKYDVRAIFSVALGNEELVLGALNLYAQSASDFDAASQRAAALFADQIGVAAANVTRYAEAHDLAVSLQRAMESRASIEQAKGILMATQRCTPDQAFAILTRASQRENRKLRSIAEEIVERHSSTAGG